MRLDEKLALNYSKSELLWATTVEEGLRMGSGYHDPGYFVQLTSGTPWFPGHMGKTKPRPST